MKPSLVALPLLFLALALALASPARAGQDGDPDVDAMLGQMVMVGFRGTGEAPLTPDLENLLEDIGDGKVGGVVLFEPDYTTGTRRNIVSIEQAGRLAALLQGAAAIPLFVAVDQEGGRVRRFRPEHGFPDTPSPREMGRGTPEETRRWGALTGRHLALAGVNLDFAPTLDLDVNPDSPAIGRLGRSFSPDASAVAEHAAAFAAGLWSEGVLPCYKHFPGHGSAVDDSHHGFTDITDTWSDRELRPYRDALAGPTPCMVMIGHLTLRHIDPAYPASLSRAIVARMLREGLGWDGVVVTDDMQMRAIGAEYGDKEALRLAVEAGVDIILVGGNLRPDPRLGRAVHGMLKELADSGAISPERIRESYGRIMALKKRMGLLPPR